MSMMLIFYQELKQILVGNVLFHLDQFISEISLDEYATYIRLIDEILEQRYNYVIQSRRTIETFPVSSSLTRISRSKS